MTLNRFSKILLILTFVSIVSVAVYFAIKTDRSYGWYSKADEVRYASVSWNKITTSKLDGLTPKLEVRENRIKLSDVPSGSVPGSFTRFLLTEGGGDGTGYWLEVNEGLSTIRIDSLDKLKEIFSPVDSESEAVSFVSTTARYLKVGADERAEGYVAEVDDGYLVRVMLTGTLVCGYIKPNSSPSSVIYRVSRNGDIQKIASETGPDGCSD